MQCYRYGMSSKHDDASKTDPQGAAGGRARSEKLTSDQRSQIARDAAKRRWSIEAPVAICGSPDKPLTIAGIDIECYVVPGDTRVITQSSFMKALGRRKGGSNVADNTLPPFLGAQSIKQFITPEIIEAARPIPFTVPRGGRAFGYRAELLPDVCELYLKARDAGTLPMNQKNLARQADILVRGLAQVGIIALVDEATGFQELRKRDALVKILEAFVDKELQPWTRTFPDDYYREMFRLRGLRFPDSTVRRPQYFGLFTNDIVYGRLAPGVLDELKRVQRRGTTGRPKDRLFQHLTNNTGYPKLLQHLGSVVTLMKISNDWDEFKFKLDQVHPRFGETMPLGLEFEAGSRGL